MGDPAPARVLLVNHVGEVSGAENSLLTLAHHLDRRRIQPVAAVPAGRLAAELDALKVPVSLLPPLRLNRPRNPWEAFSGWLRLKRWGAALGTAAEELGAQLIAANSVIAAVAAAGGPARELPIVWHARDLRAPRRAVRWVVPRVTRIAAISACVADNLCEAHPAAQDRITLIYNGIDRTLFYPERSRTEVLREFRIADDAIVIGNIGQLVPWKRQDLFLEAAAGILARNSRAWFLVVGADIFGDHPEYVADLRQTAVRLGLSGRLVFTGYREDVASLMGAMDVLVHCAADEPLGRVLIEAMSLGVPCVAVDSCGPSEVIEDGESGILVPPGEPRAISDRVVELLSRQGGAERMGATARRRVDDLFSASRMARLTENLYEEALAAAR